LGKVLRRVELAQFWQAYPSYIDTGDCEQSGEVPRLVLRYSMTDDFIERCKNELRAAGFVFKSDIPSKAETPATVMAKLNITQAQWDAMPDFDRGRHICAIFAWKDRPPGA